jgi:hypothetical protein
MAVRVKRIRVPKTRDPVINARLESIGPDREGRQRYWIASYNAIDGATGILVDEIGNHRLYRFGKEHPGFYSACIDPKDPDALWLCGTLDAVVRLTLSTGTVERFATGAPKALVFQGMVLDPGTRKLFAAAFPDPIVAFSFDLDRRKTVKLHESFTASHYTRESFPNGDGTWSIALMTPVESLLTWDPRRETLANVELPKIPSPHSLYHLIADDAGRRYFPYRGWYDGRTRSFVSGPRPETESTWFARWGNLVVGADNDVEVAPLRRWDLETGKTASLGSIPNNSYLGLNVTPDRKIVGVSRYGEFVRLNAENGEQEVAKILPVVGVGHVDCVCRIDERRLLGTPFITQRFWVADLKTGRGEDCGKAAPGAGEVLQVWKIGKRVYQAAYTGGELTEYDPDRPARFPENPRVVARPRNSLRPIGAATDGRRIFYSCSAPYGSVGSEITCYDTETGLARYANRPCGEYRIRSLGYDRARNQLLCGLSPHSDCHSCPPTQPRGGLAVVDADSLTRIKHLDAPGNSEYVRVVGPLGRGKWLFTLFPTHEWPTSSQRHAALDLDRIDTLSADAFSPFPDGFVDLVATAKPGRFVMNIAGALELWDMAKLRRVRTLVKKYDGYKFVAQDRSLYVVRGKEIVVYDGCL